MLSRSFIFCNSEKVNLYTISMKVKHMKLY
nr:MAG TPA: hypothetical protein [Caudoviricetes sp.]